MNKKRLFCMLEVGVSKYQLSLDGLEETHDKFHSKGSFKRTVEAITNLEKTGIASQIMFTLYPENKNELFPLIDFLAAETPLSSFVFDIGTSVGNANTLSKDFEAAEIIEILEKYLIKKKKLTDEKYRITLKEKSHLFELLHYKKNKNIPYNAMRKFLPEIKNGLEFLSQSQSADGNFPDGIFSIEHNSWIDTVGTIFSTSLVIHSLTEILKYKHLLDEDSTAGCNAMVKKSLDFFISEMKMPGLWRFGTKADENWNKLPLDIDDSCCVSHLLKNYHPYIHLGMNKKVILKNRNEDGLFYTWFKPGAKSELNNIDSIVNVNALLYLGENINTKNITEYICSLVNNDNEEGSFYYYSHVSCLYYLISRAYVAGVSGLRQCRDSIIQKINEEENNSINELITALQLTTLLNFDYKNSYNFSKKIAELTETQAANGSWKKIPFYQGSEYPKPISLYFGSECISTAMCLETLIKYKSII